ncbi:mitochondrial ribosome-associated GTPase 1 [Macrobrachium rosenbergii]|uniref:mitochondrial ribosome-associated GTPase 1 n=1 Tax=Macrobrachium rosenbergii TaxID=79674 RepID=UPI0034D4EF23
MTGTVVKHGLSMRKSFDIAGLSVAHWFPGHMAKGLNQMQRKLKSVDCIVEVHDSRIPISGRNPIFGNRLTAIKPHLLVMNKADMISHRDRMAIEQFYEAQGFKELVFTNCKRSDSKGIKSVIPRVCKLIEDSERYNRSENSSYQLMVIGIPNVGKSSLINALRAKNLRRAKASAVGGTPGVTQSVLERIKVCENPEVFLLDTPGILLPKIPDVETGLKLAVAATVKDHIVGETSIADYLLFILNDKGNHKYVDYLGLEDPTDDITELLILTAVRHNWYRKSRTHQGMLKLPNTLASASMFLKGYRTGKYGPVILDDLERFSISS